MAGEDSLAGPFALPDGRDLARGEGFDGGQAHLIEVPHGHLVHHTCVVKVFGCFMDRSEDRATILPACRRFLQEHRF